MPFESWTHTIAYPLVGSMLIAGAVLVNTGSLAVAQDQFIGIAGGPAGGSFFPVAAGIAEIVNRHVDGVRASAESTGGGMENITLVGTKRADLGIGSIELADAAVKGVDDFAGKGFDHIKLMGPGTFGHGAFHVRRDSDIHAIADLAGKRVALGPAGSSSAILWELVLEAHGLALGSDYHPEFMSFTDAGNALRDGLIDAVPADIANNLLVRHPASVEMESSIDIRFISPFDNDEIQQAFAAEHPLYVHSEIEPEQFDFLDAPLSTVGFATATIVRGDLDEDTVYNIVHAIFENRDEFGEFHPFALAYSSPEGVRGVLAGSPVPIHPGAERYYREKGYLQ